MSHTCPLLDIRFCVAEAAVDRCHTKNYYHRPHSGVTCGIILKSGSKSDPIGAPSNPPERSSLLTVMARKKPGVSSMSEENLRLDGKAAIVTGSSRGIGAAIARKLAEAGASVVLSAPEDEEENLREVRDEIVDADHDGTAVFTYCDVTDIDAVAALGEETVDQFGSVDILVNNAGGGIPAPMKDIDTELWNKVISLNLGGTFNCLNTIGRQMTEQGGGGAIVNMASMAGETGYPGMSPYAASKAAIINLTRSIASEWSVYDVRVNAVAPGSVATERIAERLDHQSADEIDRETVARRVGKPEEIADVVRFLASPAASYVTAETYNVAGVPNFERRREVLDVNDGSSTII